MQVNTTNFTTSGGITGLSNTMLNFGGGLFNLFQGAVSPNLGAGVDINWISVVHRIVDAAGNTIAIDAPGTSFWEEGGQIKFSSQTNPGWIQLGQGYRLKFHIEIDYTQGGVLLDKNWTVNGQSLNPPAIPTLSLSASINPQPAKSIHTVSATASYVTNGATILQRKIWLNGAQVSISGTNPFSFSLDKNDATPPINYSILAEVQYQINLFGIITTGWVSASAQVTYYGEQLN